MLQRTPKLRLRTLFLSDIHLGTKACQAECLLDFLAKHEAETIYLVGDVVDGWKLRRSWYWPQSHSEVVDALLSAANNGTRVIYVPGNHDEFLRPYVGSIFGRVEIASRAVHQTVDGKRLLIVHGDEFDVVLRWARWVSVLGAMAYNLAFSINGIVDRVRRRLGMAQWSFSDWAKRSVKTAVSIIGDYEKALVAEAKTRGADGIVCGHIHHAAMHDKWGIRYINTGDWMESCTAVVEHWDGTMEVVRWREVRPFGERAHDPARDHALGEAAAS